MKRFVSTKECPAVACMARFVPEVWIKNYRVIPIKGGW